MDIRNFLVLFASGAAGHETSTGLKRRSLYEGKDFQNSMNVVERNA
jgi:hypothetical protein